MYPGAPARELAGDKSFVCSSHPWREICFVVQGKSLYQLEGRTYELAPGSLVLIDSQVRHASGYLPSDAGLIHLWLCLYPERAYISLFKINENNEYLVISDRLKLASEYIAILKQRWDEMARVSSMQSIMPDAAMLDEYMRAAINMVLDEIAFQLSHAAIERVDKVEDPIVNAIMRYANVNSTRNCSYSMLEKLTGYNRYYLARYFRRKTNLSIGDYINYLRAKYVYNALKQGITQKEIAYELGFSSPSNFWSWLRKHKAEIEKMDQDSGENQQ